MFAYIGDSYSELNELYRSLAKSAKFDEIRAGFSSKDNHRDGWGYAIYTQDHMYHYRTERAIFEDDHRLPKFKGPVWAVFHARSAADDSPIGGSMFSHPFFAASDKERIFLCQNGTIPRRMLPDGFPKHKMGTEYVLDNLVGYGVRAGVKRSITEFKGTNTNWLIMRIGRDATKPSIYCLNRYVKTDNPDRNEYYTMYQKRLPHGRAVFSSTLMKNGVSGGSVLPYSKLVRI